METLEKVVFQFRGALSGKYVSSFLYIHHKIPKMPQIPQIPLNFIQPLPTGPLDIVGDIHGEYDALCNLLGHLGYDQHGKHPKARTLVFVGDFCDRGPNSPAVLEKVQTLVESGCAVAVLGNHEINLLSDNAKEGSGWFFETRMQRDYEKYAPFQQADSAARTRIVTFLSKLPVGLERRDLRIVHAAWLDTAIKAAAALPLGHLRQHYDALERMAQQDAVRTGLAQRMAAELEQWTHSLENPHQSPPFLHAHAQFESSKQMKNPLKVLTSGVECKAHAPFYSSGKWRFSQRVAWWDDYDDATAVVIGHYWRRLHPVDRSAIGKGDADLFRSIAPLAWHGKHRNVFCVDYSAGGRWTERQANTQVGEKFKLAALRWPERIVQFDDGQQAATH